jgi:hypothetical protein
MQPPSKKRAVTGRVYDRYRLDRGPLASRDVDGHIRKEDMIRDGEGEAKVQVNEFIIQTESQMPFFYKMFPLRASGHLFSTKHLIGRL